MKRWVRLSLVAVVIIAGVAGTISVLLIRQFIVSSLNAGQLAVLDFTCPNEWVWNPNK